MVSPSRRTSTISSKAVRIITMARYALASASLREAHCMPAEGEETPSAPEVPLSRARSYAGDARLTRRNPATVCNTVFPTESLVARHSSRAGAAVARGPSSSRASVDSIARITASGTVKPSMADDPPWRPKRNAEVVEALLVSLPGAVSGAGEQVQLMDLATPKRSGRYWLFYILSEQSAEDKDRGKLVKDNLQ
mmetsp:Transcript_19853/g.59968  ORF Transcript_19853/g.59968 Transcript_19853/m.59968 type:complete len:194 (-) Transcript_19853:118-699(-)